MTSEESIRVIRIASRGAVLADYRRTTRLSQAQFARRCGLPLNVLQALEQDGRRPRPRNVGWMRRVAGWTRRLGDRVRRLAYAIGSALVNIPP